MKTLALSDLYWNRNSRDVDLSDTIKMSTSDILNHPYFSRVKFYFEVVARNSPDLLLLCGDITGDGSCGHGYVSSLIAFLRLVESIKIQTRYISGNHDESQFYAVVKRLFINSECVGELTHKIEKIGNIKVLGLSYEQTKTKTSLRKFYTPEVIDIVACHCDHTQRLNLFDFKTDFIITGHFDQKVINPSNITFISLDNDTDEGTNYVVIEKNTKRKKITFYALKRSSTKWIYFKFSKTNKTFYLNETNFQSIVSSNDNLSYLDNIDLKNVIELVLRKKLSGQKLTSEQLKEMLKVKINRHLNVSKAFLNSYIGTE